MILLEGSQRQLGTVAEVAVRAVGAAVVAEGVKGGLEHLNLRSPHHGVCHGDNDRTVGRFFIGDEGKSAVPVPVGLAGCIDITEDYAVISALGFDNHVVADIYANVMYALTIVTEHKVAGFKVGTVYLLAGRVKATAGHIGFAVAPLHEKLHYQPGAVKGVQGVLCRCLYKVDSTVGVLDSGFFLVNPLLKIIHAGYHFALCAPYIGVTHMGFEIRNEICPAAHIVTSWRV